MTMTLNHTTRHAVKADESRCKGCTGSFPASELDDLGICVKCRKDLILLAVIDRTMTYADVNAICPLCAQGDSRERDAFGEWAHTYPSYPGGLPHVCRCGFQTDTVPVPRCSDCGRPIGFNWLHGDPNRCDWCVT
jgi:hypothetical protein